MTNDPAVERAKYLDWCSARVAEQFLRLTPEETYALAEEAVREEPRAAVVFGEVGGSGSGGGAGVASAHRIMVERVTEVLVARLGLPSFEEWREAYRRDPAVYDRDLLGFWRAASDP